MVFKVGWVQAGCNQAARMHWKPLAVTGTAKKQRSKTMANQLDKACVALSIMFIMFAVMHVPCIACVRVVGLISSASNNWCFKRTMIV
jgi:hypothetical protein